jgi:hypothetical protein
MSLRNAGRTVESSITPMITTRRQPLSICSKSHNEAAFDLLNLLVENYRVRL